MKNRAFTMVELLVVIVVFTLLFYAILQLMSSSNRRLGTIEDDIHCSTEAAMLFTRLRNDLEKCMAPGDPSDSLALAQGAVRFVDNVLTFPVIAGQHRKDVIYAWNDQTRTIEYHVDGTTIPLARGLVTHFFACHQILCEDNVVRSVPFDPDQTGAEPPMPDPTPRAGRTWVKVFLTLEKLPAGQTKPVQQKYVLRFFPVRLNHQLQSIWYRKDG